MTALTAKSLGVKAGYAPGGSGAAGERLGTIKVQRFEQGSYPERGKGAVSPCLGEVVLARPDVGFSAPFSIHG